MNTYIVGISNHIAEKIMTSKEVANISGFTESYIINKLGFKRKRVSTLDEHPYNYAINATISVLNKTAINPIDLNFIIYCSSGIFDYQFWSPAGSLQNAIGAKNALTFEINNGCNSSTLGMFLGSNLLTTQKWNYGLIVVSETLSKFVDYSDKNSFPLFSISDGASAIILGQNHKNNLILSQSLYSDGEYAGCNKIKYGGTQGTKKFSIKDMYIKLEDEEKIKKLREHAITEVYIKVIKDALQKANINQNDLTLVLTNQNTQNIINNIFKELKIPKQKTYSTIEEYGHIAGIDTLFALDTCIENKLANKNNLILLATAGIGFNWGAQIIRI